MPPREGELKFNVDRATRGKLGCIGGAFWNSLGVVVALFSKHMGIMESNETKVLAILEALRFISSSFHDKLGSVSIQEPLEISFFFSSMRFCRCRLRWMWFLGMFLACKQLFLGQARGGEIVTANGYYSVIFFFSFLFSFLGGGSFGI